MVFDCPVCGVHHEGLLTVKVTFHAQREVSTSACGCVFVPSEWIVDVVNDDDLKKPRLAVLRRLV
jgi:hypothetical protein